ncbi:MAG: hypothetical protein ACRD7E_16420, partial [Bryobacteraceae bacterium]
MGEITFAGRRAVSIENGDIRVTVVFGGGHIAEILHKKTGVNPLWIPPWPSIEPSAYHPERTPEYGADNESKLLSGILGHNLCLDLFGAPSEEEYAAGISVHGEGSVTHYSVDDYGGTIIASAHLRSSQLHFERKLTLDPDGKTIRIRETVENRSALDRPIAWTQHVTLGPSFLKTGSTQFRASATRSKTYETPFGPTYKTNAEFDWPNAPLEGGGTLDMQTYTSASKSGGFTTHLMDPHRDDAFFLAWSPESKVLIGYKWKREDFPWLGIWEENHFRTHKPWNGEALTRGMEFGASPFPETRRQMIERRTLFGVPA